MTVGISAMAAVSVNVEPFAKSYAIPLLPLREQRCGRRRVDNRPLSYLL